MIHIPAGTGHAVTLRAGQSLRNDFGVTGHRSCSDNFLEVLRAWRIERHQLPHPINFFQNMRYPDGRVEFGSSLAKPGDVVELRALISPLRCAPPARTRGRRP